MKKIGITVFIAIIVLATSSCTIVEPTFFGCVKDSECEATSVNAKDNPNLEVITYINSVVQEEMSISLRNELTIVTYDEYTSGDIRLYVQVYEGKDQNKAIDIAAFNSLFNKISTYMIANNADYSYLKVELKTVESFESKLIYLDDNIRKYRSLIPDFNSYNSLSDLDEYQLQEDAQNFSLFNRVSYDFMYEDISLLFDYDESNSNQVKLNVVHRHTEDTFPIPYDAIHQVYIDILSDYYTVILEKDE
ncbi:hypothetical protein KQ51_01252 [Candidatus Izimaplasma bacterium HR1]|jgi:hypothetical protein|uniref:hypothetical protein n=1 Tax=Candidatus Izimoplasma sp. HR1 TaxID=1541959 RepID=UPI0004F714BE|nr:hypothetical protein KQ51_01252 [Candidatus Izimaplasma bacterium HR1]